jgi:hypothetical protein
VAIPVERMLVAGVGPEVAVGATVAPEVPPVSASAAATGLDKQTLPVSSTSTSVYVLGAIRILFDAYGVS